MGNLMNLAVYNPAILSDADFMEGFVARREQAENLLERLREIKPRNLARHQLVLGQRGMGKTSLLRRLAIGIQDDSALSAVLLPLSFREEQYNIHNLRTFWLNCLDALADWFEKSGQTDKADALDREIAALAEGSPDGDDTLATFKRWYKAEGRRPLLLLDNIDLILDGLADQDWSLRRALQEAGGIVVVGATAGYLEATADPQAAFYDFFQVTVLERLPQDELLACLRRLAEARGEAGDKVREVVARDPGRIRTLYDLTGGNPRTLVLLYMLLEMDAGGDVMSDLERLLDQVTVLYKARVEDLAPQARVVLDALALNWNPATAADVAKLSGLETPTASTQLDRLLKAGIIEKVSVSTSSKSAFQIGERFFNIWYLMRHGPRRQRTRLRWLTGFLQGFYTPAQLCERGRTLLMNEGDGCDSEYRLALGEAIGEKYPGLRYLLCQSAREGMERLAVSQGKRLEDLTDPADLPTPKTVEDWVSIAWWLRVELNRPEDAETALRQAIAIAPDNAGVWNNLGNLFSDQPDRLEEAEGAYRHALEIDPQLVPTWNNLGLLLSNQLGRFDEAEAAYRRAIETTPGLAWSWNNLGNLLRDHLGRNEEAEVAYRRAIEINPDSAWVWNNLGKLLRDHSGRIEEAEAAYRRAIEIDPGYPLPWHNLGYVALYFSENHEEAQRAYQAAQELEPDDDLVAKSNLLVLQIVQGRLQDEAEFEAIASRHPPHGMWLLRALRNMAKNEFAEAKVALKNVLDNDHPDVFDVYQGFLILTLRQAAWHEHGDDLLVWLDEQGLSDRYWPLRAAFDAYLHGEARLMDVNPEVRGAAKRIFDWLDAPRRRASPSPAKSKARPKNARGSVKASAM